MVLLLMMILAGVVVLVLVIVKGVKGGVVGTKDVNTTTRTLKAVVI